MHIEIIYLEVLFRNTQCNALTPLQKKFPSSLFIQPIGLVDVTLSPSADDLTMSRCHPLVRFGRSLCMAPPVCLTPLTPAPLSPRRTWPHLPKQQSNTPCQSHGQSMAWTLLRFSCFFWGVFDYFLVCLVGFVEPG